jgi:rare lipoprotein A
MMVIGVLLSQGACAGTFGRPVSWGTNGADLSSAHFGEPDFSVVQGKPGTTEVGRASWYGPTFYGKRTASGAIFRKHGFTAAHRTLPLGTWVRVTNLANKKSVDVLINDRGPFVSGRIIDLSWEAANSLEILGPGTGLVRLTVLSVPGGGFRPHRGSYAVQVASFSTYAQALNYKQHLARYSYIKIHRERFRDHPVYRVQVGNFHDPNKARSFAREVKSVLGSAFIVQTD